ncbi:unnamed protein product, partial [Timema podura]|nr:unnamed protein product [Timema podura]
MIREDSANECTAQHSVKFIKSGLPVTGKLGLEYRLAKKEWLRNGDSAKQNDKAINSSQLRGYTERYQPSVNINPPSTVQRKETGIRAFLKEISSKNNINTLPSEQGT